MPPSGFNSKQSTKLTGFLYLCLEDLILEASKKELSYNEAMKQEIQNIDTIQTANRESHFENHLLEVVKFFYQELLKLETSSTSSLKESGRKVLNNLSDKILDIHVPEIKK
ncbi:hypothetical protein [Roseivirga pacifica]|uniref:hypothetical protein n=1 Tax=Roseivirga pacifica TaxID=1267423 RepID=UPI003BAD3FE3